MGAKISAAILCYPSKRKSKTVMKENRLHGAAKCCTFNQRLLGKKCVPPPTQYNTKNTVVTSWLFFGKNIAKLRSENDHGWVCNTLFLQCNGHHFYLLCAVALATTRDHKGFECYYWLYLVLLTKVKGGKSQYEQSPGTPLLSPTFHWESWGILTSPNVKISEPYTWIYLLFFLTAL